MCAAQESEFVAECLWPDVRESDLRALDERVRRHADRLAVAGLPIFYIGSMLMREDEVVLCLFEGERDAVREVARAAEIPFERILETARSPWSLKQSRRTRRVYS
jgi:hypothetical protein